MFVLYHRELTFWCRTHSHTHTHTPAPTDTNTPHLQYSYISIERGKTVKPHLILFSAFSWHALSHLWKLFINDLLKLTQTVHPWEDELSFAFLTELHRDKHIHHFLYIYYRRNETPLEYFRTGVNLLWLSIHPKNPQRLLLCGLIRLLGILIGQNTDHSAIYTWLVKKGVFLSCIFRSLFASLPLFFLLPISSFADCFASLIFHV